MALERIEFFSAFLGDEAIGSKLSLGIYRRIRPFKQTTHKYVSHHCIDGIGYLRPYQI